MDNSNTEFGRKLKELRNEKGFTVRQLALQAGISNSYLSQVENGKRSIPKPATLEKIAKGMRVPKEDIFLMAGISNDSSTPTWATDKDQTDLERFLRENEGSMTYGGENLTEEEKDKLKFAMTQIFWRRHKHPNGSESTNE